MYAFRVPVILIIIAFAFAGQGLASDPATEVKGLVQDAVAMFGQKGREYTLRVLNTLSGPFRKGSICSFAVSMKGVMLAHPANKDLVGKDVTGTKDWNGTPFFREMITVAQNEGKGWVEYWWLRHAEKKPTLARTFVMKVPNEDLFIAATYYAE